MRRIRLIHWKPDESTERAEFIRVAGYEVDNTPFSPHAFKQLRSKPPDAVVIDLERLPAQGRDLGVALRGHSRTRHLPLVFVGGMPEKVERVKELLPDAVYTSWSRIRSSLKRAMANPPDEPVAYKSAFAGYAGTPLPIFLQRCYPGRPTNKALDSCDASGPLPSVTSRPVGLQQ